MNYRVFFSLFISLFFLINGNCRGTIDFTFYGETIPLKGDWNLVMNEFLSFEEIQKDNHSIKIAVPGTWNDVEWKGKDIGPYGFGTYYTTIILDPDTKKSQLAIEVSEVSLAYRLFINEKEVGGRGIPGKNKSEEKAKIDYHILDFESPKSDTLSITFHVSNYSHESGGLWYAPNFGFEDNIQHDFEVNKTIKLLILGMIIIVGLFQIYIFIRRRREKFGFYFFLVCVALTLLSISRGDMPLMDMFPNTSWQALKKIVYISIFFIAPTNALFLLEVYPKYYHKRLIYGAVFLSLLLIAFTLIVPPRVSYFLVPPHHVYNLLFGVYLFISLLRAAKDNKFGARFLVVGYLVGFLTAIHDSLKSQYIIEGLPIEMIHIGTLVYIFQLIFILAGRYIYALESKEKANDELEQKVEKRTRKLSKQKEIIEQQNESLQSAIEDKNHLMAVVAHDLKAPFDSISGISELMKPKLDGSMAEFNDMIKKMTLNGKSLIENLTQLSYYEKEDFEVQLFPMNMEEFFKEKCVSFEKIAQEKEVKLTSSFSSTKENFITDKSLLERIVDNLLSNAIKFSPANEQVHFKLTRDPHLIISIKDNGPGFSESDKQKAFGKFQKLSAKPTGGESSTGLGLSIVKTLTELLNGSVKIISEHGKGAEIIVSIPEPQH